MRFTCHPSPSWSLPFRVSSINSVPWWGWGLSSQVWEKITPRKTYETLPNHSNLSIGHLWRILIAFDASSLLLARMVYFSMSLRLYLVMRDGDVHRFGSIDPQPKHGERLFFIEHVFLRSPRSTSHNASGYSTTPGRVE